MGPYLSLVDRLGSTMNPVPPGPPLLEKGFSPQPRAPESSNTEKERSSKELPLLPTPSGGEANALEATSLAKSFGPTSAVDHPDFVLRRGDLIGLVRPDG